MKAITILTLALLLFGCGGKNSKTDAPPATDTTELHGNTAQVILKGNVESIHSKAQKFNLSTSTGELVTVKVHPTIFLKDGESVGFDALGEGQYVTVSGLQNPGIVKADTVWLGE